MCDPERLARIADEELAAGLHGTLMHTEDPELADVRVHGNLEAMRDHVLRGVRCDVHADGVCFRSLQEQRWIALTRIRHEAHEDVEQLCQSSAAFRGDKTHRYQVSLA